MSGRKKDRVSVLGAFEGRMSERRSVGYESIPEETTGGDGGGGEGGGSGGKGKLNILWIGLIGTVALMVIAYIAGYAGKSAALSTAGIRSGSPPPPPEADGFRVGGGGVPLRPCEVHDAEASRTFRMIQTSRGEPSRQWGEVACTVHAERPASEPVEEEYGVPSAIIDVDFVAGPAFPGRGGVLGFGGAFTEAAALNYGSLTVEGKEAALELLFGKSGLGYSLGRTHINSCDFSVESYSFDDTEDDFSLEGFDTNVTHDVDAGMIDMMTSADRILRESWPGDEANDGAAGMKIVASPWSPPAWMKAPHTEMEIEAGAEFAGEMTGSALPVCIRDGVGKDSKYAKSWALFFSKFISAYANHGIDLYGVTVQNEPEFPAPWEACAYDAYNEGEFIAEHLGPVLAESHPDVKLLIFDHNKDHVVSWADTLLDPDHPASRYIDGTAYHWYAGGMDRLLDGAQGAPNMHRLISELEGMAVKKSHVILGSEACHCPSTGYAGGDLTIAWSRAMRNAHTILADLAAGSDGFIEWNLILDSIGGPNHLGNMCDAPILAVPHRALTAAEDFPDTLDFEHADHPFGTTHGDQQTREELNAIGIPAKYLDVGVAVQPMYYYVGHISRYVRPGSFAVKCLVDAASAGGDGARTFRPSGQTVAGGGINDLARDGMEVTVWPCEGSTRQEWKLNGQGQLQVFGHDWLGVPTASCVGKEARQDLGGLMLTSCDVSQDLSGLYEVVPIDEINPVSGAVVNIVLSNGQGEAGKNCMIVQQLGNNGGAYGPRGGAQVNIGECDHPWAKWTFDAASGEISSKAYNIGGDVCLTTGWPFLQAGAFDTSPAGSAKNTIVVHNEAGEAANYILRNGGKIVMSASIPSHSIQTLAFD